MPRIQKSSTISGVQYNVVPVGAHTGGQFIFRVGRVAAALVGGAGSLVKALQSLPPAEFDWAIGVLIESTTVGVVDKEGGGKVHFVPLSTVYDDHFSTDYDAWGNWILFAVEVSFGSFFGKELAEYKRRLADRSSSDSPKESTGGPGASSSQST